MCINSNWGTVALRSRFCAIITGCKGTSTNENTFLFCRTMMAGKKSEEQEDASSIATDPWKTMNLDTLTLVWCDKSHSNRSQLYESQVQDVKIRRAINFLRKFSRTDECQEYIRQIEKEKVVNNRKNTFLGFSINSRSS